MHLDNQHQSLFDIDSECIIPNKSPKNKIIFSEKPRSLLLNIHEMLYNHLQVNRFLDNVIPDKIFHEYFDLLIENISN
jgi:hypothetical protein